MKKRIILGTLYLVALSLCLAGCRKSVDLKAEYERLYANAEAMYNEAQTPAEAEAALQMLIDSSYVLLSENMDAVYADSLFGQMYYMFSTEQRQSLFSLMPKELLEREEIAELHKVFVTELATSPGHPYTDIVSLTPDGKELALSELVGKTDFVLVDFWASWCGPCRRLLPVLKDVYQAQPEGRLQILGCSVDRDEAAWLQALDEEQLPWPQIRDQREGAYVCGEKYGVTAIPTTILINREGNIIARNPDEAELEAIFFGE